MIQGGETIKVHLDQAKLLKVPDGTSTLVVGNPLIADVAVQPGGTLVVTGKGYGNTNLVALDRSGSVIMEHQVQVQGPLGPTVVVFRGVERETYSCTPDCERRITLGDTQNYFAATSRPVRQSQYAGAGRRHAQQIARRGLAVCTAAHMRRRVWLASVSTTPAPLDAPAATLRKRLLVRVAL